MTDTKRRNFFIILLLGFLTAISPFSIDMYLPAFQQIATALETTPAKVSWSLSSYFVGISLGQVIYGPLLDRYGRKRPIYAGLSVYILASFGCMFSTTVEMLIVMRFVQALGGCVAGVAAMAMVRDFFPLKDSSKIFSLLMLILGVSPLLAPTIGGFVSVTLGWQWVFIVLASITALILAAVFFFLPEGHQPDPSVTLKPKPIALNFLSILEDTQFRTYAFAGALAFTGLLVYVAGSSIIFMDSYKVDAHTFGIIFAIQAAGFIGASQLNILLVKYYTPERIFSVALTAQCIIGIVFVIGVAEGWFGLWTMVGFFFAYLACTGLINPNSSALALAPFTRNLGSASALLGFLQIGLSSLASTGIGFFDAKEALPIIAIMACGPVAGLLVMIAGQRKIAAAATSGV